MDPVASAKEAGLRYVRCDEPGFRRVRRGKGFAYLDAHGARVAEDDTIRRIRSLAIPPAWTDVWICAAANGHLQATGKDVRGRKQYRYHPKWRDVRDEVKYERMIDFARALPRLRRRIARDLRRPGVPKEKVVATAVKLLDETWLRVGNVRYAKENGSFGITTLRDDHVRITGSQIRLSFRGKGGKRRVVVVEDAKLARIVRRCRDIPGQELFQYVDDDGASRPIESGDVNDYLCDVTCEHFTAKDFRTWAGTLLCTQALMKLGPATTETEAKANVIAAIDEAAEGLGDTRTVTRNSYIHPDIVDAYGDGSLFRIAERRASAKRSYGLRSDEALVLAVLLDRRRRRTRTERRRMRVATRAPAAAAA